MTRIVTAAVGFCLLLTVVLSLPQHALAADAQLGHMVFFTLKDRTPENREKLAALCRKYLDGHEGTVYFSVGTLAEDFDREVNEREWDVALHLVFENKAAHDTYQDHPRHLDFIKNGKDLWAKVRVFDSYIPASKKAAQ